jgi:hypothetical protein
MRCRQCGETDKIEDVACVGQVCLVCGYILDDGLLMTDGGPEGGNEGTTALQRVGAGDDGSLHLVYAGGIHSHIQSGFARKHRRQVLPIDHGTRVN